jgi:hypothetical protein
MRHIIVIVIGFFLLSFSSNKQTEINKIFTQDVATIYTAKAGLLDSVILKIIIDELNSPLALTENSAFYLENDYWKPYKGKVPDVKVAVDNFKAIAGDTILAAISGKNYDAVGTHYGLYLFDKKLKTWQPRFPVDQEYSWSPRQVAALMFDSHGRLWFGSQQGVGYLEDGSWHLFTGKEGLPYNKFTCATSGKNGVVWFGTEKGAIRYDGKDFSYRFSRRWLPNDHVNDIAVQENGTVWIATKTGISRIISKPMTMEQKATYFIDQVEKRHSRMGFIAQCHLTERYNINSWIPAISDNDGLYTAMYGAAHAFRYAITKDRQAKELATRSFNACKWLVDITHESGFPARVIIPVDWHEAVNEQYDAEYNQRRKKSDPFWKDILPRFVLSKDKKYLWKCDTSSDELIGHYFFYGIYYDLVAESEEEKKPVRQVVSAITDHLIRNGFVLIDHDGKPTRWANFSPDFFNSVKGWEQRGLNSMMMLSFLNVAEHITGDSKYTKTAQMLREKHFYHINAMQSKMYFPPDYVVPWDNNLCLMSMYGLMNYEKDPELLLMYRLSLEHAWLHISRQKNAFWNSIYGALSSQFAEKVKTGLYNSRAVFPEAGSYTQLTLRQFEQSDPRVPDILETLYKMPLDLIGYDMDNTHRLDVVLDPAPGQVPTVGWRIDGGALPLDERGHVRQDRDGFALYAAEDSGFAEHEGTFFLLPYYMARYHGLIK